MTVNVDLHAAKSCNCWNSAGDSFSHVKLWFCEATIVLVDDEDGALDSVMLNMEIAAQWG